MSLKLLRAVCLICLSMPLLAQAKVEIQAHNGMLAGKISEQISPGDYEQLLAALRAHPGQHNRKVMLLDSIGGSAPEAMRMGRLLRETGFEVIVPRQGVCQGSCIYLLAAGAQRRVNGFVALSKPAFAAGDSALAQAEHGKHAYSPARYLKQMGVAPELVQAIYQVPHGRLRLLSYSELSHYRLITKPVRAQHEH